MNTRQKAKHFKRLYEESKSSKKAIKPIVETFPLNHCLIQSKIDNYDYTKIMDAFKNPEEFIKKQHIRYITNQLEQVVLENLEFKRNPDYQELQYVEFDFWIKG